MRVVGWKVIEEFCEKHSDVRSQLRAWLFEARDACWRTPSDIKARYSTASFLSDNRVVFNIKGGKYRLEIKVNYKNQIVLIRRVGTHSEYDKWVF
jgi:mRNA interferase HigB